MGIVLKETIKGSIYQYLGIILGGLNISILFPQILGDENFGILNIIVSFVTLSSQFSLLGGANIIIKYFPRVQTTPLKGSFVSFNFLLSFIGFLLFTLLFFLFKTNFLGEFSSGWTENVYIIISIPVFVFLYMLFQQLCSFLLACYKSSQVTLLRELIIRLVQTIGILAFFYLNLDFLWFLYIYIFSYFTVVFVAFVLLIKQNSFDLKDIFRRVTISNSKDYLQYGLFTVIAGFSSALVNNMDILMLGSLLTNGEIAAGKYKTMIFLTTLISIPLRPFFQIIQSLVSNYWDTDTDGKITKLYKQSGLIGLLVSVIVLALLLVNINWMEVYIFRSLSDSFWVLFFVGTGVLIFNATGINGVLINFSKHYRFSSYSAAVLAIINLVLNYFLINKYGIYGAAIATGFSVSFINIYKLIYLKRKLKLSIGSKEFTFVALLSILLISLIVGIEKFKGIDLTWTVILNLIIIAFMLLITKKLNAIQLLKELRK